MNFAILITKTFMREAIEETDIACFAIAIRKTFSNLQVKVSITAGFVCKTCSVIQINTAIVAKSLSYFVHLATKETDGLYYIFCAK